MTEVVNGPAWMCFQGRGFADGAEVGYEKNESRLIDCRVGGIIWKEESGNVNDHC